MSERDELVARSAGAMRRALWVRWGDYAPDGDETLGSLGDEARAGYAEAADAVLAELERTHVLVERGRWERVRRMGLSPTRTVSLSRPRRERERAIRRPPAATKVDRRH